MKPGTKDEVAGKVHEVKGKVKENVGKLTNNPDLEVEGQDERSGEKSKRRSAKWRMSSIMSSGTSVNGPALRGRDRVIEAGLLRYFDRHFISRVAV